LSFLVLVFFSNNFFERSFYFLGTIAVFLILGNKSFIVLFLVSFLCFFWFRVSFLLRVFFCFLFFVFCFLFFVFFFVVGCFFYGFI
jgi:hypothetical protein